MLPAKASPSLMALQSSVLVRWKNEKLGLWPIVRPSRLGVLGQLDSRAGRVRAGPRNHGNAFACHIYRGTDELDMFCMSKSRRFAPRSTDNQCCCACLNLEIADSLECLQVERIVLFERRRQGGRIPVQVRDRKPDGGDHVVSAGLAKRHGPDVNQTDGSKNSRGLAFETNLRIGGGLRSLYLAG
jgi:hypothetical protein